MTQRLRLAFKLMIFFLLTALLTAGVIYAIFLADLPGPGAVAQRVQRPSTLILDRHGRLLYEVIDPNGSKQASVPLADMPLACRQAAVATEDKHFYQHPGVDLSAIARALWQNTQAGETVSGASTITQQVARNLLMSAEERYELSLRRKLREAWLAWRLEQAYSKDQLLALYLNQVYFGNFAVGLEAASQAYLGASARELDTAQCALLIGLLQSPARYNPLLDAGAARKRQATVLSLMVEQGYLSAAQADLVRQEPLQFNTNTFPIRAPHFVMYVSSLLEQQLGVDALRQGGLRVTTTLDLDWQQEGQAIVQRRLRQLKEDRRAPLSRRVDNAALVALDPQTGEILALVGSPDYFDDRIQGNVNAALSLRQPGSAIKPLTYAAAFDPARAQAAGRAPLNPATLVADVRTVFPTREGEPYVPLNYDLDFHGPVLLRDALGNSFNIPAVKVLQFIGVPALVDQAQRLGISSFVQTDALGLALTLGGGEVRLLELTAAYGAFASGGRRVSPVAILKIENRDGQALPGMGPTGPGAQVLSPQVAYLITDILSDNEARVRTFGRNSLLRLSGNRPAAVKTGTTTDWKDNWTVGYTPDLVVGVWVGNADNASMIGVSGVTGAAPIWHDFMETVLHNTPAQDFERPPGLVEMEICSDSGLLPTDLCPYRRQEIFIACPGQACAPTQADTMHQRISLDGRTMQRATPETPPAYRLDKVFWALPPELQEWARAHDIAQPPPLAEIVLPAQTAALPAGGRMAPGRDATLASGVSLTLTSPDPARVYRLSRAAPADTQQIEIAAQSALPLRELTLTVNGRPLWQQQATYASAWWQLQAGEYTFQAIGITTAGETIQSAPITITVIG
ncbi:transglycosylase domain-containing protein [Candidatus Amarolinea dominans]|uniref:transglycosylase domain-containing protein n=1 Tax=Candidatus Amarolinea dominans TaxID=3140696 RepID=UPI003136AE38|nr:transglycosylase domain-containing protein [Anaerolineae bacterium]MBK9096241.1 transglycosylase domain-containing protein [Anaerolineae bacterium]